MLQLISQRDADMFYNELTEISQMLSGLRIALSKRT